jgi:hypothetical protein
VEDAGVMTDTAGDIPLRGRIEIEWSDGQSGWGAPPRMTWSLAAKPPLDAKRTVLLFSSLLDAAERRAKEERTEET